MRLGSLAETGSVVLPGDSEAPIGPPNRHGRSLLVKRSVLVFIELFQMVNSWPGGASLLSAPGFEVIVCGYGLTENWNGRYGKTSEGA